MNDGEWAETTEEEEREIVRFLAISATKESIFPSLSRKKDERLGYKLGRYLDVRFESNEGLDLCHMQSLE